MKSKKWYQSKGIWTGIIIVALALYDATQVSLCGEAIKCLPEIPEWVFAILGALGIYARYNTTKTVK